MLEAENFGFWTHFSLFWKNQKSKIISHYKSSKKVNKQINK